MPMLLQHDARGAFLALSPAEAPDVLVEFVANGIRFTEDDGSGAGCAGPEAVVVRFPDAGVDPELGSRLAEILRRAKRGP